jgi:predicted nucleotidyltransferase component of viral defense system
MEYQMRLHENKELFSDAILKTSQELIIPEIFIEKDYWVTFVLHSIFHSEMADIAVFKGGTALSKCHKLIERFSEDIDLVVIHNSGENDNQLKTKLKMIGKIVENALPEIKIEGVTNKKGNIRKTAHQYDKIYKGNFGQVKEFILLEVTWLGNSEPNSTAFISSYVAEMMKSKGLDKIVEEYGLQPFEIPVLSKERTLCEKIMSLVRFSRQGNPYDDLSNKIRHFYDIHMMLKNKEIKQFFESEGFDSMMMRVAKDDIVSFKNNNKWVYEHPSLSLIFKQPQETWDKINTNYQGVFNDLVFGELPSQEAMVETIIKVADRLKKIEWKLDKSNL